MNKFCIPAPAATATTARGIVSVGISASPSVCPAAHSFVCSSMFLISMFDIVPMEVAKDNACPGSSMCTWILTSVSSPATTAERPKSVTFDRILERSSPSPSMAKYGAVAPYFFLRRERELGPNRGTGSAAPIPNGRRRDDDSAVAFSPEGFKGAE